MCKRLHRASPGQQQVLFTEQRGAAVRSRECRIPASRSQQHSSPTTHSPAPPGNMAECRPRLLSAHSRKWRHSPARRSREGGVLGGSDAIAVRLGRCPPTVTLWRCEMAVPGAPVSVTVTYSKSRPGLVGWGGCVVLLPLAAARRGGMGGAPSGCGLWWGVQRPAGGREWPSATAARCRWHGCPCQRARNEDRF